MDNSKLKSNFNIFRKLKRTSFDNLFNLLLSLIMILLIGLIAIFIFKRFIFASNWNVVTSNIPLFVFGSFPTEERWRPAIWIISLLGLFVITIFGPEWKWLRENLIFAWILTLPLGLYLLYGGFGLSPVMSRNWGGLTLTIFFNYL